MSRRLEDLSDYAPFLGREPEGVLKDLEALVLLLEEWQRVQNLVSRETLGRVWERHILDSLQLLPLIRSSSGLETWIDIGSGGGFPALPLAIALKGRPIRFHLIESNGRKCAFLRAATRALDLAVTVHCVRIESAEIAGADVLTARALAPLPSLFGLLHRFWGPQTMALLHKGREFGEEIAQADSSWVMDMLIHPSSTDPDGVILEITALARRPDASQNG